MQPTRRAARAPAPRAPRAARPAASPPAYLPARPAAGPAPRGAEPPWLAHMVADLDAIEADEARRHGRRQSRHGAAHGDVPADRSACQSTGEPGGTEAALRVSPVKARAPRAAHHD